MRHKRVSCPPSNLAALAIGIALANVSMKASNNSVKPDPARGHGVATLRRLRLLLSALRKVDRETAEAGLLELCAHLFAGLTHGFDAIVKRHEV